MISKKLLSAAVAGALLIGAPFAQAQFTGGEPAVVSVASVLSQGKDDQYVSVEGNIIQKVGKEDYIFKDATGQIKVEIDDRVFNGQQVSPTTKVRLTGEIDKDFHGPMEIDVNTLVIIK